MRKFDEKLVRKYDDKQAAQEAFSSSIISCSTKDCLEFIGGVYTYTEDLLSISIGSCSATLISKDRIITNRHCIPSGIAYKGAYCAGQIKIHFPETLGFAAEKYECDRIENLSIKNDSKIAGPDWAIIKLKTQSQRTPVVFNRSGIQEDSTVNIYKINFDLYLDKPSRGEVVKTTCLANSNHILADNFIGSQSAVANVSDCDHTVIKGNSGSGILNDKNELIGVLSFSTTVDYVGSQLKENYPTLKENSGGGTNLACIEIDGFKSSDLCDYNPNQYGFLAKIYAHYKAQKSDKSFFTPEMQSQIQEVQYIEMTTDIDASTLESFDWNEYGVMAGIKNFLAQEMVKSAFIAIPSCIKEEAPSTFKFKMPVRVYDGQYKDENLFFQTIESVIKTIEVRAKVSAENSNLYTLNFPDTIPDEFSLSVLGKSKFYQINYKIPKCKSVIL